jgi:high affinity Mn2+ porin
MPARCVANLAIASLCMALAPECFAQQAASEPASALPAANPSADVASERFAVHGQLTFLEQLTSPFHAPYSGPNSLSPRHGDETFDMTLFLGARLWSGAEAWINPEIDQGFGLDDTLGLAGFPSGTSASANRWVFTVGKISVPDIFDANQYAHDPRNDFFNWAAVDAGTFDYAADSWGFTAGAAAEWYQGAWTLRAGAFDLSEVPNSETLDHGLHEFQWIGELEKRHELMGKPGKLLMTVFETRGRMALLDHAVSLAQASGESVATALVDARRYRSRAGLSLNLEQQLLSDLGMFARVGKAAGNVETYEFSDIDRTVSAGLSMQGKRWGRADDTLGVAAIDNGISATRERFLNAGGLGILVGDGKLPHPGAEQILETYYRWAALQWAQLTLDYQYVVNPAYNSDRGPVSIVALRLHAQF